MKPEKKISPHNLFKVLNHIEKYVTYIFIYLNQSNSDILSILPSVSIIYNLISKYIYKKPFQMFNDNNQNNIYNFDYGYNKENEQYQINNQIEDINFDSSSNNTSRENNIIIPNFQELKHFFDKTFFRY